MLSNTIRRLKIPHRNRSSQILALIATLSGFTLSHGTPPKTAWHDIAKISGDWHNYQTNINYIAFSPKDTAGSATITIDYSSSPLDLSEYAFISSNIDNKTSGTLDISVTAFSNPNEAWSNQQAGRFFIAPETKQTLRTFMLRESLKPNSEWVMKLGNLYAFPNNYHRHWRFIDAKEIKRIVIRVAWKNVTNLQQTIRISPPKGDTKLTHSNYSARNLPTPLVDEMGQFRGTPWEGYANRQDLPVEGKSDLSAFSASRFKDQPELSAFGGWTAGPKLESNGYFRTEKVNGNWWFVTPDGFLFWSLGVTEAGIGSYTRWEGREGLFPTLAPREDSDVWTIERGNTLSYNFYHANLKAKYGENWRQSHHAVTQGRIKKWGLNTIGAWSMEHGTVFHSERPQIPYTVIVHTDLNSGIGDMHEMVDPFSEQFDQSLDNVLKQAAAKYNGDPNNIGVFINNELHWWGGIEHSIQVMWQASDVPAKQALITSLRAKYSNISALNKAWGSQFESFKTISPENGLRENTTFVKDLEAFYDYFADTFFAKCRAAAKKNFPQHLYLGCRFNVFPPIVTRAASRHCDVMSFNLYRNSIDSFQVPVDVDRPFLISEFHFGSGSKGVWGRGLTPCADDQNQADLYKHYVEGALKHPKFVGAHWFTWSDQPVTGRYDGENFRVGLVSITDRPHPLLIDSVSAVSETMYKLRHEISSKASE